MKGDNPGGPDLISWRALKAGLRPSSESGKIPPGGPDESSRPTPRAFQTAIHNLDSHSHPLSYRDHPIFAHKHIHTHTPCILRRLYIYLRLYVISYWFCFSGWILSHSLFCLWEWTNYSMRRMYEKWITEISLLAIVFKLKQSVCLTLLSGTIKLLHSYDCRRLGFLSDPTWL